jgi:phenylacetate-CoA ligase
VRCIGRTDDMLIVRGVNVFPSAVRAVVAEFTPEVTGMIAIRPKARGVKQSPPLPVTIEAAAGAAPDLGERLRARLRQRLVVATAVTVVAAGTLPRSDYKSKLVDWSEAAR